MDVQDEVFRFYVLDPENRIHTHSSDKILVIEAEKVKRVLSSLEQITKGNSGSIHYTAFQRILIFFIIFRTLALGNGHVGKKL